MCGRFQLSVKGKQISERYNTEVFDEMYTPSYNCAPSQYLPVVTNDNPSQISYLKWGLIPFWAKDPKVGFKNINTRAETISEKPSFRNAFARRRCLIPANGFYEWKKDKKKIPFRIALADDSIMSFAGIWEQWKDSEGKAINTFSIITTEANKLISSIHHRMPVILHQKDEEQWLKDNDKDALQNLLAPLPSEEMKMYEISPLVNSPKNNSPEILLPPTDGGQKSLF